MDDLSSELAELAGAEANLNLLRPEAAGLQAAEGRVPCAADAARRGQRARRSARGTGPTPGRRDGSGGGRKSGPGGPVRARVGRSQTSIGGQRTENCQGGTAKSSSLSGTEDCPLCGQPLGDAFASVQAHREQELEAAQSRLATSERAFAEATKSAEEALAVLKRAGDEAGAARQEASRLRAGPSGPRGRVQTSGYRVGRPGGRR